MNDDLIKKSNAIKAVLQKPAIHGCDGSWYHADDIKDALESVPSADRPQGEWIKDGHHIRCKECGVYFCTQDREGDAYPQSYCPNCGARMKGADDEM